ncbi:MAG: Ig-like domain-containing protein [Verrucomicrobia bacterium]|nr:Ig-like domain-containing protein [Verrucomicrobiota bacterium]
MKIKTINSCFNSKALHKTIGLSLSTVLAGVFPFLGIITGEAMAQSTPKVVSVTPSNGSSGVSVSTGLVFTFDQEMNDGIPIMPSIPGFFTGNVEFTPDVGFGFDGEWGTDKRTLTITFSDNLDPNTSYTWKLNPAGAMMPITSATGVALPTTTGSFTTGSGGGGGTAPKLVSSSPANGAFNVPRNVNVVFVFDRPMKKISNPGLAIEWQGTDLDPAKFSYTWSADGTTLTCDYAGDLPAQSWIAWQLNPGSASVLLESQEGELLPEDEYQGVFLTAMNSGECDPDGVPDTWGTYGVQKTARYEQTSAADPTPEKEQPFFFSAIVFAPAMGPAIASASVTLPSGSAKPLTNELANLWAYMDYNTNEAALDSAYPAGNYTLRFALTNQPERVITMNMPATKPPVPKILNYAEAQAVNAAQDFTLRWNQFTGAGANDSISLIVHTTNGTIVFRAPDLCVPRPLPVSATSIVIPANTFKSNATYTASLTFHRTGYSSTNAVPEMAGSSGVGKSTSFTIKTGTGGSAAQARFTQSRLLPNGNPEMTLTGSPQTKYTIERSKTIGQSAAWTTVGIVNTDTTGKGVFEDTQAGKAPPLFYRAVAY